MIETLLPLNATQWALLTQQVCLPGVGVQSSASDRCSAALEEVSIRNAYLCQASALRKLVPIKLEDKNDLLTALVE